MRFVGSQCLLKPLWEACRLPPMTEVQAPLLILPSYADMSFDVRGNYLLSSLLKFFFGEPYLHQVTAIIYVNCTGIKYIICYQTIFLARFSDQTFLIHLFLFFFLDCSAATWSTSCSKSWRNGKKKDDSRLTQELSLCAVIIYQHA